VKVCQQCGTIAASEDLHCGACGRAFRPEESDADVLAEDSTAAEHSGQTVHAGETGSLLEWTLEQIAEGRSDDHIARQLLQAGWTEDYGDAITFAGSVRNQLETVRRERARKTAVRDIAIGAAIAAVAGGISLATYEAASSSPEGGTYYVFWGGVVYGGYMALKGFAKLF
jgi:hypothetical protein